MKASYNSFYSLFLVFVGATAFAQTRAPDANYPGPGVYASVQDQVFRLTDPVGCVVWTEARGGNKVLRNQCNFRVEVVGCAVGSDRPSTDCGAALKHIKGEMTALDPHPQRPGNYDAEMMLHSAPPFPRVTAVVACPGIAGASDYSHGKARRIWQVEKAGGLVSGKCLTPYDGKPPAGKVKTLNWPYYSQNYNQDLTSIPVKIVQD